MSLFVWQGTTQTWSTSVSSRWFSPIRTPSPWQLELLEILSQFCTTKEDTEPGHRGQTAGFLYVQDLCMRSTPRWFPPAWISGRCRVCFIEHMLCARHSIISLNLISPTTQWGDFYYYQYYTAETLKFYEVQLLKHSSTSKAGLFVELIAFHCNYRPLFSKVKNISFDGYKELRENEKLPRIGVDLVGVGGWVSECLRGRSQRSANEVEKMTKLTAPAFSPKVTIASSPNSERSWCLKTGVTVSLSRSRYFEQHRHSASAPCLWPEEQGCQASLRRTCVWRLGTHLELGFIVIPMSHSAWGFAYTRHELCAWPGSWVSPATPSLGYFPWGTSAQQPRDAVTTGVQGRELLLRISWHPGQQAIQKERKKTNWS